MKQKQRYWAAAISVGLLYCLVPLVSQAQIVSTHIPYDEKIRRSKSFAALDENLFGDKINLQDGSVAFTQDDVILETNSQLRVSLGRKTPSSDQGLDSAFAVFGRDWELNVPYMMASVDTRDGWSASPTRCSTSNFSPKEFIGPWPNYYTQIIPAFLYWHGVNINIPGHGEELLLHTNANQVLPADGKTYYGTTKSSWRVSCLPSTTQAGGEVFVVALPDGTTYYFDWRATRNAIDLDVRSYVQEMDNQDSWNLLAPLTDVFLYATKVVDRFGNSLTYSYDLNYRNRLTAITSNDGVRLDIQYNATGHISTVNSGVRTWLYTYVPDTNSAFSRLQSITLPDLSKWSFELQKPTSGTLTQSNFWSDACKADPKEMRSIVPVDPAMVETLTMIHPSGAKGEFKFRRLYHGTNNTPGWCWALGPLENLAYGTNGVPFAYVARSVYQKTISGPAVSDRTWSYMFYPNWSFAAQCSSGCPTTSQTTVQTNDLVLRRYTFGNSYSSNVGQLLSETVEKGGSVKLKKDYSYLASAVGQPFPDNAGDISRATGDIVEIYGNPFKFLNRPLQSVAIQLDGATLTHLISSFDAFVRPLSVTKSSSLGYRKTDATEYHDGLARWVLGQIKRSTTEGIESSKTDYDELDLPRNTYAFGKLEQTLAYNADGTMATVKDSNNQTTTLSSWHRGVPRNLGFPDLSTMNAVVNDSGWITSATDQLGSTTSYGYDAMGRLSFIAYPTGDSTTWTDTSLSFVPVAVEEYGIPTGHWKQTGATGSGKTTTFYDALWQPVLLLTEDTGNAASKSFVVKRYDTTGRLVFISYPVGSLTSIDDALQGTTTVYDALGRVTQTKQDSELAQGLLTTTTEYLTGLQTRVTNPRSHQTTTSYQVFDQPDTSRPVLIQAPEGTTTTITRDVFGKPTQITRSGG